MSLLEELKKLEDLLVKLIEAADRLADPITHHHSGKAHNTAVINKFKQAELLAHSLAYTLTPEVKKVMVADEDGVQREYLVQSVATDNKGLVSFVLYDLKPNNPRIHVMFRGTHNIHSGIRDIENSLEGGPGFNTFKRNEASILKAVAEVIATKQKICKLPLELNAAGHSLGGADTQLFSRFMLNAMATPTHECYGSFNKLSILNIMHANSAGVTKETAAACDASLQVINRENVRFKINQYIIHFGGDVVQQSGYDTIFATAKYPKVNTTMLKGDAGQEEIFASTIINEGITAFTRGVNGAFKAHTQMVFGANNPDNYSQDIKFKIYNNADPKEAEVIERSLTYKALQKISTMYNAFAALCELGSTVYSYFDSLVHTKPKNKP